MTDWTRDPLTLATQASSAFEELRAQLREAARDQRTPPPDTLVGDRYRVVRELGQGGFGSVHEVRHELLGHRFAMKLLNAHVAADPDWVARFKEEARATSLIGHESIVFVTDFGEDDEWGLYFVMEYLDGLALDELLDDEGPQAPERVLRFVHAAASALGAVHEVGIIHCDLKPSNVFCIPRKRQPELWKFLDFGTSTVVMDKVKSDTLYGTPRYMAPEQSVGRELTERADQFSIGCVVYEMLTGQVPWNVTNWLMAMPEARSRKPPQPPSALAPQCPESWDEPILRSIAVDPEDRWPSLDAFAAALLDRLDVDWKPTVEPLDVRHRRGEKTAFARTMTAPSVAIKQPDGPPSVVVDVETGEESDDRPVITVGFRTRERFMREYRRNLSVGGLFIPSEELLSLRTSVRVVLEFTPTGESCEFDATVVGHEIRREAGRGFGLALQPGQEAVESFMEHIRGPALSPNDVLVIQRDVRPEDVLTAGQGFALSRIDVGMTLARLRSLCAGLPFDVDESVAALIQSGLIAVGEKGDTSASEVSEAEVAEHSEERGLLPQEIESILERVEFHRHQANYLSARDVLQRALSLDSTIAEFHYQLATLRREFADDTAGAAVASRRAVELEPDNSRYRELLASLRG